MEARDDSLAREWAFFADRIDPLVRRIVDAADPWVAYDVVVETRAELFDHLDWLPHGGEVFIAWANLEDLFETGMTPTPDCHAALRGAATRWCERPNTPSATFIESWLEGVAQVVRTVTERDGDFWRQPHPMTRFLADLESEFDASESRDYEPVELVRYALTTTDYWADLAIGWLETGVPATHLASELESVESRSEWPQALRHRAKRLRKARR